MQKNLVVYSQVMGSYRLEWNDGVVPVDHHLIELYNSVPELTLGVLQYLKQNANSQYHLHINPKIEMTGVEKKVLEEIVALQNDFAAPKQRSK